MRYLTTSSWLLLVGSHVFVFQTQILPVCSIPTPQLVGEISAVYDLIDRVLGRSNNGSSSSTTKTHPFHLQLIKPAETNASFYYFQLEDLSNGKIQITGTTANELSAGVGWYLRHYCNMTIGWPRGGGSHIVIPPKWPKIGMQLKKKRQFPWSYLMNVCTHSYSLVWYDQSDWEQFIDWLALTGINLILALTGQEEIQYQVLQEFGLKDLDIRSWFNGPALLTWSRGQNEYGSNICGPLPRSWMKDQYNLQRNHILPRLRSLGIVGQLPGFQGNVPIQLKEIYQDANMTKEGDTAWMDSLDPLYDKIADVWMQKMIQAFGTDHWYQLDGYFNGATAPWIQSKETSTQTDVSSPILLDSLSHDEAWFQRGKAAYQGLARTDPDAVWSFQGFSFIGWDQPDQAEALKGFIDAVPKDHFVIIDMSYTGLGEWTKWDNASYFGTPFVWTALHDFGGTDGIKGDLRRINQIPSVLLNQPTTAIGLGGTPEGIDQNPAYYDFLFEGNWREGPVEDLAAYMGERKERQYGVESSRVRAAWKLLMSSLYSDERSVQDTTGVAHLEPRATLFEEDGFTPTQKMCQVHQAWEQLLLSGTEELVEDNEPFRYDLVNLGREVLAQLSSPMAHNFSAATKQDPIDSVGLNETGQLYMELLNDIDALVSTDSAFLLGPWIESAREWGMNNEDDCYSVELNGTNCKHFYEWNARTQITTWNPTQRDDVKIPGGPIDYAAKHWGGLIKDYYAVRASLLLNQGMKDSVAKQPLNQTAVDRLFAEHAYEWTTSTNSYPTQPLGDPLTTSYDMFFKYLRWFQACADDPDKATRFPLNDPIMHSR